jgi:hypothetical protein
MTRAARTEDSAATLELRTAFAKRYGELVDHLARTAPPGMLAHALGSSDPFSGLAAALGVAATLEPPRDPLAEARARSVEGRARLLERAGGVLRVGEVAGLLGISPQAVHARRGRATILALPLPNGEQVYPACQFDDAGVIDGLREVLAAFRDVDAWTQLSVLLAGSRRFGGKSAIELLREGEIESALGIAATYGEHVG